MDMGRLIGGQRALAPPGVNCVINTATLAEIIATKTIVPGYPGVQYRPVGFWMIPNGTFTTADNIELESTNSTPVSVATQAIAGAGDNVFIWEGHTNMTLGAGFGAKLGVGDGIRVVENGSTLAGGTDVLIAVFFQVFFPDAGLKPALGDYNL